MTGPTPPAFAKVPKVMRAIVSDVIGRLPEADLHDNGISYVLRFRTRSIGTLVAVTSAETGATQVVLVLLADPEELPALLAIGHPYFPVPNAAPRIGIVFDDATDRAEIAELVIDAYRRVAPKRLVAEIKDLAR